VSDERKTALFKGGMKRRMTYELSASQIPLRLERGTLVCIQWNRGFLLP
jgi:hypothetical protein